MGYEAISVDLPWSRHTRSRTAIAAWGAGRVLLVTESLEGDSLPNWIATHAAPGALVVLDVPIDDCADLCRAVPRRRLDDGLSRAGIPILPSHVSGDLGASLRATITRVRPDVRVLEIYPYAVLRVLWGLWTETRSVDLRPESYNRHSQPWPTWWTWPPKYKRREDCVGAARGDGGGRRCHPDVRHCLRDDPGSTGVRWVGQPGTPLRHLRRRPRLAGCARRDRAQPLGLACVRARRRRVNTDDRASVAAREVRLCRGTGRNDAAAPMTEVGGHHGRSRIRPCGFGPSSPG